jgi:hypothetical protein
MTIDDGTAIVLAYVLVSMGVIIAFLLAVFVIGWFIGRLRQRRRPSAEATDAEATDGMGTMRSVKSRAPRPIRSAPIGKIPASRACGRTTPTSSTVARPV